MRILLDTNLLVRLAEIGTPQNIDARSAITSLQNLGHELCVVPQVIYEYWVVATRPTAFNGLGISIATADKAIEKWLQAFIFCSDEANIFLIWKKLVKQFQTSGKPAHDARLVAALQFHQLDALLTFNAVDFQLYTQLKVFTPEQVNQLPPSSLRCKQFEIAKFPFGYLVLLRLLLIYSKNHCPSSGRGFLKKQSHALKPTPRIAKIIFS